MVDRNISYNELSIPIFQIPSTLGSINLALGVIRQVNIYGWKEDYNMDYQVAIVLSLHYEQCRFWQTTQILLQILSGQQFLTTGTFEGFILFMESVQFTKNKNL